MAQSEKAPENPLGYEKVSKLILQFAIPSIAAMLITSLYNIVDQVFIGQGVGMLGNAATNVAFPLTTVCIAVSLLLGIGGAANFNLQLGAGDEKKAAHFLGNTITLLLLSGVVLVLLVQIFLQPLMVAFGATEMVLDYALTYTKITSLGFPFVILSNGLCNQIRADGSPVYSMCCMFVGAVINMILDPLFIFVLDMGIAGAAWATVISQVVSCVIAVRYLFHFKSVKITKEDFHLSGGIICSIAALGAAGCFNQLAMMVVQIALNNTLTYYGANSPYGSDIPLACVGIIAKVGMIFMSVAIGLAQGCQPIFSFNYGAKNYARVKETLKLALIAATCCLTLADICFQLFPRQIISLFGEGSEVYYRFAERYFRIYLAATFLNGIQPVVSNFFSSIGKAYKGIIMSLTRQVLFLLPLILLLPYWMGIDGVMYAGPIADIAAALLTGVLAYWEIRQINELISQQKKAL